MESMDCVICESFNKETILRLYELEENDHFNNSFVKFHGKNY